MNPGVSDDELLWLIRHHYLVERAGHVFKWHWGRFRYVKLKIIYHWKSDRQQHSIRFGDGRFRKIGRGKLLMMIERNQAIPDDMEVDHRDHDHRNESKDNLRLRDKRENRQDNWSKANFDECMDFFSSKIKKEA